MWRFDIGGGRNVSQKWICWTGQAMLFRCCGTVIFGWFLVLWGYQSAFQWCLGVRLPRFEAKTTILQATQTSLNCVFIAVSDATFRRQACAKGDSTRDPCGRPGHAVSLLRICHFWLVLCVVGVSIGFSMVSGREAARIWGQNHDFAGHPNLIELCFYGSFRRNVSTLGMRERWFNQGSVRPTRPCCFAAADLFFLVGSLCCRGGINRLFNGVFWDPFWGSAALGGSP